jgi:uncharacterized protein YecE (DUF72 family)
MRQEAAQLVRLAVGAGRRAYVLVNNRAEGNAPLTVQVLTDMLSIEWMPDPFQSRAFNSDSVMVALHAPGDRSA